MDVDACRGYIGGDTMYNEDFLWEGGRVLCSTATFN